MTTLTDVREQIEEARPDRAVAYVTVSAKQLDAVLDIAAGLLDRLEALEER